MLIYLLIGTLWTAWLEWYTTTKLSGIYASPWRLAERIFTIAIWPFSLLVFLYNFFKGSGW